MSLFGSLMQEMERDPIFGAHHRAMNRMMNSFMGGAGNPGFGGLSLMGPGPMRHPHQQQQQHSHRGQRQDELMPFGGVMSPFGAFGGGFPDLSGMMPMMANPNGQHAFSSSSFVSFTSNGDGRPQVYQATSETRNGPGGVRETRRTMTDSRTGTKKMAVGRHLGEQAHVVEREQNLRTGQLCENHEFVNLEEEEAPVFDREWKSRAQGARGRYSHSSSMPAIAAPPTASSRAVGPPRPSSYVHQQPQAPEIVELDDNDESYNAHGNYQPSHSQSAVQIEELPASDEEAEPAPQQPRSTSRRTHHASPSAHAASSSSSYRRSPHGASKEKRQKRSKLGKK